MARYKLEKTKKDCIYSYIDTDGKTRYSFRYKYYDRGGKRREKSKQGFNSIKEAERALIEVKATVLSGNERMIENDYLTVSQWMDIWMESKKKTWRPNTYVHYQESYKNHIKPLLGHFKLQKLTNMTVQRELVDKLVSYGFMRPTIRGICALFKSAINAAVIEEILPRNRITKLDFSAAPISDRENFYTEEELTLFLECVQANDPYTRYSSILTLAMTGMRKGEMMALTWKDIDFEKKTIKIDKARTRTGLGPPKSDNGYRTIQMNDELAKQLKSYRAWCIQKKWSKNIKHKESDYVFVSTKGCRPIGLTYVEDAIDLICTKYNLKRISPHGLRHTFASILLSRKVPLITVAEILGDHPNTVQNEYAHSFTEKEIEATDILNEVVTSKI